MNIVKERKLKPIRIVRVQDLSDEKLKVARSLLSESVLRTKKNPYGSDKNGKYHICYLILNLLDGRFCAGKHTFKYNPKIKGNSNYHSSSSWLRNSIRQRGEDNFVMCILKYFKTSQDAFDYEETELITKSMIESKLCYNKKGGGRGWSSGDLSHNKTLGKDGLNNAQRRAKNGTHNLQKGNSTYELNKIKRKLRVDSGTHCLQKGNLTYESNKLKIQKRLREGSHQFQKRVDGTSVSSDNARLGLLYLQSVRAWDHPGMATEITRYTWYRSGLLFKVWKNLKRIKKESFLISIFKRLYPEIYNLMSFNSMVSIRKKFKKGWVPKQDKEWLAFKLKYKGDLRNDT